MLKRLKSVSMMLFLMGASTGAAYAVSNPGITDVKIAQQDGAHPINQGENSLIL